MEKDGQNENPPPPPAKPITLFTPQEIYDKLSEFVIGQEAAKRTICVAAYNHLKRILSPPGALKKNNVLMVGPTGCGKTHIARTLAKALDLPFVVVNATEYTEAGYYGKDAEVMIAELLFATDGDLEATERGIVFVDEIDKVSRRGQGANTGAGSRDIGGEGVQQAMLKLLEANKVFVPLNVTQHWSKHDFVQVDVSNILFICAGTFSDIGKGRYKGDIGYFGKSAEQKRMTDRVTTRDLEEFGMIAELLGRLPVLTQLRELTNEQLETILVEPPDALIREIRQLYTFEKIELDITKDALKQIVIETRKRKLGARGLRGVVDEVFAQLSFHAPDMVGAKVQVDGNYVRERLDEIENS
jgi:ATP-dependent Clp protease ATP-binding subunit ClpX